MGCASSADAGPTKEVARERWNVHWVTNGARNQCLNLCLSMLPVELIGLVSAYASWDPPFATRLPDLLMATSTTPPPTYLHDITDAAHRAETIGLVNAFGRCCHFQPVPHRSLRNPGNLWMSVSIPVVVVWVGTQITHRNGSVSVFFGLAIPAFETTNEKDVLSDVPHCERMHPARGQPAYLGFERKQHPSDTDEYRQWLHEGNGRAIGQRWPMLTTWIVQAEFNESLSNSYNRLVYNVVRSAPSNHWQWPWANNSPTSCRCPH